MARGERDPALERQWRERMGRWQMSGMSIREFCLRRGLTEPTFHYWKRELQASPFGGGQVVPQIHGGSYFAASGEEEAEVPVTPF